MTALEDAQLNGYEDITLDKIALEELGVYTNSYRRYFT